MDRSGFTLWLTGMRGAGKSTLATYVGQRLRNVGRPVEILDGVDLEKNGILGGDAGKDVKRDEEISAARRAEAAKVEAIRAVRRLGYLSKLLTRNNVIAISAAVSPHREPREATRREIGRFVEVFVDCPVEQLIARDTKGLYKKALAGELPNFTGITEPYEPPTHPEVVVSTHVEKVEESAQKIFQALLDLGYLRPSEVSSILGQKARVTRPPPKVAAKLALHREVARAAKPAPKPPAKRLAKPAAKRLAKPAAKRLAKPAAKRPGKPAVRRVSVRRATARPKSKKRSAAAKPKAARKQSGAKKPSARSARR